MGRSSGSGSCANLNSLSPVLRGEGRGEGQCASEHQLRSRALLVVRASLAPLPNPLPGVPGRGNKCAAKRWLKRCPSYSLSPVVRGEGRGEGRAICQTRERALASSFAKRSSSAPETCERN